MGLFSPVADRLYFAGEHPQLDGVSDIAVALGDGCSREDALFLCLLHGWNITGT